MQELLFLHVYHFWELKMLQNAYQGTQTFKTFGEFTSYPTFPHERIGLSGTLTYKLGGYSTMVYNKYVRPQRVWFFSRFDHK